MAFFSEIFFSTLIGKPVYTLDEVYFGTFRDFIIKRQNGNFLITKVRIRTLDRKRIILPWSAVHSIEADPIILKLTQKLADIAPIEYDDDELRLKRDFLDQQIIDTEMHRVVRVNDLKVVAVKDELFVVAADIGLRGLLRRLGFEQFALSIAQALRRSFPNTLIPSSYIDPFPARLRHDITLSVAQDKLKQMHPADLADILSDLDDFERISIIQSLPVETVARTIGKLEPEVRRELLGQLKDETVATMLERLAPNDATDIMAELPKRRMQHLLAKMKVTEANEIRELMQFKEGTAGSLMSTEFVACSAALTAGEALLELQKKAEHAPQIYYLYVVDERFSLAGAISLKNLVFVDPSTPLATLVKHKPISVRIKAHTDEVAQKCVKYNLIAIPVVGRRKKLEGVISVDDILKEVSTE